MPLTPKTLAECAAEFRGMMEDAIRQQHFETAATCKQFLLGIEAAQAENERLSNALQAIADESQQHHEHNPVSGKDRLPQGYITIRNLACAALKI